MDNSKITVYVGMSGGVDSSFFLFRFCVVWNLKSVFIVRIHFYLLY